MNQITPHNNLVPRLANRAKLKIMPRAGFLFIPLLVGFALAVLTLLSLGTKLSAQTVVPWMSTLPDLEPKVQVTAYSRHYSHTNTLTGSYTDLNGGVNNAVFNTYDSVDAEWNKYSGGWLTSGHTNDMQIVGPQAISWQLLSTANNSWPSPPWPGISLRNEACFIGPFTEYNNTFVNTNLLQPDFPLVHVDATWSVCDPNILIQNYLSCSYDQSSETAQTWVEFSSGGSPNSTHSRMWSLRLVAWDPTANNAMLDAVVTTNFSGVTLGGHAVDINGIVYLRMRDYTITNVTPDLPVCFSNYQYQILATELTCRIAFDKDDDGAIDLNGTNDITTAAAPFIFWVNNDSDVPGEDVQSSGDGDYASNLIENIRDLEDYNRVAIRIPAAVCRDPNWTCRIKYGGRIKLFSAPDASRNHVTDETYANTLARTWSMNPAPYDQGWGFFVGESASLSPIVLPRGLLEKRGTFVWSGDQEYAVFYFLFKGGPSGGTARRIQLELSYSGDIVGRSSAWLKLMDIEDMYDHHTAGDTTTGGVTIPTTPTLVKSDLRTGLTDDYILFVHGWRMQTWERRRFAESAFKRLWWSGYRGHFGLFSWPTEYVSSEMLGGALMAIDIRNFDRSEWQAWRSGTPLAAHLLNLNSGPSAGKVRLFAHSMGNVVSGEALRILTKSGNTDVVHTYVSCQGALASHAYDPSTPVRALTLENPVILGGSLINADSGTRNIYAEFPTPGDPAYLDGVQGAQNFINYYNADDYALGIWCANQSMKPDIDVPTGFNYQYNPALGFWIGKYDSTSGMPLVTRWLNNVTDRHEIFSKAAEARCYSIGAQANVGGAFLVQLDLQATFGFGTPAYDHSAQFNSNIQNRKPFWDNLLGDFSIAH